MKLADELSQRGMTQTYLAERLGVHPSQVNRWCRGAGMSIESEGRIRSVLGIPEPECQLDERHTRMLALLEDRPLLLELLEAANGMSDARIKKCIEELGAHHEGDPECSTSS